MTSLVVDAPLIVYSIQISALVMLIGLLLLCLYFAYMSRHAYNGTYRRKVLFALSWIALFVFMIVRRVDDLMHIFSDAEVMILSSIVVITSSIAVIDYTLGEHHVYKLRDLYAQWAKARKEKEDKLEQDRDDAQKRARRNWDDEAVQRYL